MANNPNSWQVVDFQEICNDVSTRINDPKNSDYERYVGLEHMDTLEPKILRWASTDSVISSMTLFKKGQILFGRRNWHLRRVAVPDFDGICSADIYVFEPKLEKIIPNFLPIFMHSDQFFQKAMKYSVGSMSTRVKWSNLSKIKFIIPKKPYQEIIVRLISTIDDLISKSQILLEQTKIYKTLKSDELFTKGIGHTTFKKTPSYFVNEIKIPTEWDVVDGSDMFVLSSGISPSRLTFSEDSDILYVKVDEMNMPENLQIISNSRQKFSISKNKHVPILKKDTIIFPKRGAAIMTNKVRLLGQDCAVDTNVMSLKCKDDVFPLFMYYYLTHIGLFRLMENAGIPQLNNKDLYPRKFCRPKFTEQENIASILHEIDVTIENLRNYTKKLKAARISIINQKLLPKGKDEKSNV